jgi:hypothetical protein
MTRAILTLLAFIAPVVALESQSKLPAFMSGDRLEPTLVTPHLEAGAVSEVRVGADGRATLVVLVKPKPRMHIYSADVDGYMPFTLTMQPQRDMSVGKVAYPSSELYVFAPTGESSRAYMKPFKVTVPLAFGAESRARTEGRTSGTPGVVTLRYQACDDAVCYRPTSGSFVFEIIR